MESDIRILKLEPFYKTDRMRVPLKFGGVIVEDSTSSVVKATVENGRGEIAEGWGSMPLMDKWAFPNMLVSHERKLEAMKLIVEKTCKVLEKHYLKTFAHPIDIMLGMKPKILKISKKVSRELRLKANMPVLGMIVSTSPIDAALNDAFGRSNRICSYDGYSREYMKHDLSFYLGPVFQDKYISDYIRSEYTRNLPVFHLVGALDKLTEDEVDASDPKDGLPVSLEDWIKRDGVYCFKVKLSGKDINWDVERTKRVAEIAYRTQTERNHGRFYLSVDCNEMSPNPQAIQDYLIRLRKRSPLAFKNLLYVEQPIERDLTRHMFSMKEVAEIKPVLADEGITDLQSFNLALKLGWSGVAVKTCKWHSSSLLYIAWMEHHAIPYSIQDLTCPGLALMHSASFAARSRPLKGFEYNARQYLPFAFMKIQDDYRSLFKVENGEVSTNCLDPMGLGLPEKGVRLN